MNILYLEIKKLLKSTALWGFLFLCIIFNIFFIVVDSNGNSYGSFVNKITRETDIKLGDNLDKKLQQISSNHSGNSEYLDQLIMETSSAIDIFDDYNTSKIAECYIDALGVEGKLAEIIRYKYSLLQESVDKKASTNESLTIYFASDTRNYHDFLFGGVMKWLLTEGILFAALVTLLSVGFEYINKTDQVVYASRKGRKLVVQKLSASLLIGLGAYLLLTIFTLLVYFSLNSYDGIITSSVSSVFNYINDILVGMRPFTTWYSFTVFTYLLAVIAASAGLILSFVLMAFTIGVLIKNSYIGFVVFLIINAMFIALLSNLPNDKLITYVWALTPAGLWLKQFSWFTDGGLDILVPNFEIVGITMSMGLLLVSCVFAGNYFRRRDLL